MTPLPQRKKTAEEIAQLRDQLGVPQAVEATTDLKTEIEPSFNAQPKARVAAQPKFKKLIHADGRVEAETVPSYEPPAKAAPAEPAVQPAVQIVEGVEIESLLPKRKRSAEEMDEMRRREMVTRIATEPMPNFKFQPAHPAILTIGYLLAAGGASSFLLQYNPLIVVAACGICALAIATFLFLRRPVSRHHAAFIAAITLLVGFFSTFHHLPQLQHAP